MTRTYECMFLIDNDVVRAGWNDAKSTVAGVIEKHGGTVVTARRWAERRLAYPIRHKNRATYLLCYCDCDPAQLGELRRELDISETVMRYLILSAEEIPAEERELSAAENGEEFAVPEPPADDAIDEPAPVEEPVAEGASGDAAKAAKTSEGASEAKSEAETKAEPAEPTQAAEAGEPKAAESEEAPAETAPVTKNEGEEA